MLNIGNSRIARVIMLVLSLSLVFTSIGVTQDKDQTKMRWAVEQAYLQSRTLGVEEPPVVELALFGDQEITKEQLAELEELGFEITGHVLNMVYLKGSIADADKLDKLGFVKELSFPIGWKHYEVEPETLNTHMECCGVKEVHEKGYTGKGLTVAVMDTGFTGELEDEWGERVNYLKCIYDSEKDTYSCKKGRIEGTHGTLAARTVGTIAPDSNLYLISVPDLLSGLVSLQKIPDFGVDAVSMSIGYPIPLDHGGCTSEVCKFFNEKVHQSGALFSIAGGNEGDKHYFGTYNDPDGNSYHNFSTTGDVFDDNTVRVEIPGGKCLVAILEWDDWEKNQDDRQDFDLEFYDGEREGLFGVATPQCKSGIKPVEYNYAKPICVPEEVFSRTYYIAVRNVTSKRCGREPHPVELNLWTSEGRWEEDAVVAKHSIMNFANCPNPLAVGGNMVEMDCDYQPFPPSSQGPTADEKIKPDLAAPTCYFDSTLEGAFCGTSASAPFVTGAAVLVMDASQQESTTLGGMLKPTEVALVLKEAADDFPPDGPDSKTGYGIINVGEAVKRAISLVKKSE